MSEGIVMVTVVDKNGLIWHRWLVSTISIDLKYMMKSDCAFGTCQWLDKVNNIFLKNSRWKSNENAMHTLHFSLCLFLTFCKVRNQNTPELLTDDVEINMLQMFHSTMYGMWLVILLFNCKALGIVMAVLFR